METKSAPQTIISRASAAFCNNLYKILSKKEGNVFFSPISIHAVLSMLHHGAEGDTAEALSHALQNSNAEGYKAVIDDLTAIKEVKLMMANKIYGNKKQKISKIFEETLLKNFSAEVELLDFTDRKEASKIVNHWVEEKTEKKIKDIVNQDCFHENSSLILINAIYFKGKWSSQFNESKTRSAKFSLSNENSVDVKMMYNKGNYGYKLDADLDSQIIDIPYKGHNTYMTIILPSEDSNIKKLEAKLSERDLSKIHENMKHEEVHLYLPKFKMEETIKLNNILSEMGLSNIFDVKKANFTKISGGISSTNNMCVSDVVHKAYVKVNEGGTEASGATRVDWALGCAPGSHQPIVFKVNRPAIFMLVASHDDARNILFYGRLFHPDY